MKYYIIAGERSGDLHGGNLMKALFQQDAEANIRFWGGDAMQSVGGELVTHYKEMAFMGFWEVLKNVSTIKRFLKQCKNDILDFKPDAVILIDYAGFNLRIAKFAHENGIPVHYYISPKLWAWNQKRALKIKKWVDHMYVILPFEKDFYHRFAIEVDYVGNPLLDAISAFTPAQNFKNDLGFSKPDNELVAILPGSRAQEVSAMMNTLGTVIKANPDKNFVVAGVSNLDASLYQTIKDDDHVKVVYDASYDVLSVADTALVTSGTATLETALFEVPQVVCYKTSGASYAIAKRLVKVDYISLVNLILDKEAVKELIQHDFNEQRLNSELKKISLTGENRQQQLADYKVLKEILGERKPSKQTAELIYKRVKK
jgi:lipid-A-disaccharide synthase